jgi:hypothetical protein
MEENKSIIEQFNELEKECAERKIKLTEIINSENNFQQIHEINEQLNKQLENSKVKVLDYRDCQKKFNKEGSDERK